jgi:hypothetical protein
MTTTKLTLLLAAIAQTIAAIAQFIGAVRSS